MWNLSRTPEPSLEVVVEPESSLTKNKSPTAINFCTKIDGDIHQLTWKEIIADQKVIAAGYLFLMKLASAKIIAEYWTVKNSSSKRSATE